MARNGGLSRLYYSLSKAERETERYATSSTCSWNHLRLFSRVETHLWKFMYITRLAFVISGVKFIGRTRNDVLRELA